MSLLIDSIIDSVDIASTVDTGFVIYLLCLGFLIKHFIPKIDNNFIPFILMVVSFISNICSGDLSISAIITKSVISSALAIGLHTSGKYSLKSLGNVLINSVNDEDFEDEEDGDA